MVQGDAHRDGRRAGPRQHLAWLLVLAAVVLVFHGEMILLNHEPPAPDTEAVRPLGEWARAAQERLGAVPLWCPAIFSGMPSYGSFIYTPAAWHHLFDLLVRPFPGQRGLRYFLAMLLGGFSLYALLNRLGCSPLGAAGGTLLFVLTPYMMGVIQAGHSTKLRALYHVPLLFLAVEELLRRPRLAAAAFLALSMALLGWTRHPQIAYYAVGLAGLYALARLLWSRPGAWRGRMWLAGSGLAVLAILLAGAMLLDPMASVREYAPYSVRGDPGVFATDADAGGGTPWDYATAWSFPPRELVTFLVPEWYGLEGETYWGTLPFTQSTHYFGVIALALAVLVLVVRGGRSRWLWAVLALIVLVIGFGRHLPLLYRPMFLFLPYFNKFRVPSMIYALLPLLAAPLVAAALDLIQGDELARPEAPARGSKGKARPHTRAPLRHGWILRLAITAGVLLVLWMIAGGAIADSLRAGATGWFRRPDDAARYGASLVTALVERRAEMFQVGVGRTLFLLALLGAFVELRRRSVLPGFWAAGLVLVLLVGDLWVVGKRFQNLQPKRAVELSIQPDETLESLAQRDPPFRFLPLDDPTSNVHASAGLQSLLGYQAAKLRAYQDLVDAGGLQSIPVLDMLQTRFLVTDRPVDLPGYRLVRDGERKIYERESQLPRVWLAERVEARADARSVLDALVQPGFRPHAQALITGKADLAPGPRASGSARLRYWDEHRLEVEVEVQEAGTGLLVFSEIVYPPGWRASVDGEPAGIHTVNHVLRAVEVPAGSHIVRMEAHPGARSTALPVSRVATLLTGLLLLAPLARRRVFAGRARRAGAAHPG